jgi:hypothetical protein
MRLKTVALIHVILLFWGIIMCIMKLLGYISTAWYLVAMPLYGGMALFVTIMLMWYLISVFIGVVKRYGQPTRCPHCGNIINT